ncbi:MULTISPECIES: hypothetical protein [unclassified Acinetobacter]|uniref:hypothetical protein n=1 Tax=unclassified Acinetobacter TaxID=196816 RepID=UPI0035BABE57
MKLKLSKLAFVIVSMSALPTISYAAGLDRSGQDITAFLQDGTYAELVYTGIQADVKGHDNAAKSGASKETAFQQGKSISNIADSHEFFRYGVKADVNSSISIGVLYDEPFGASATYHGDNNFVSLGGDSAVAALTANDPTSNIKTLTIAKQALAMTSEIVNDFKTEIANLTKAGDSKGAADLQKELDAFIKSDHSKAMSLVALA